MTEFPYESVEEIHAKLLAVKATEDPDPENRVDVSPGSEAWLDMLAEAVRIHAIQVMVMEVAADILPTTSRGQALDRHAELHLGEDDDRRPATKWYGWIQFTNEGETTRTLPAGTEAIHADGTRYRTTEARDLGWGAAEAIPSESVTTGTVANKTRETELTLTAPPAGISGTATILGLPPYVPTLAKDRETDQELLERILLITGTRPGGGNAAHYVLWSRNASNLVERVFVYPRWSGLGTVLVVPLGEAGSPILVSDVLDLVRAAIAGERPEGASVTVAAPTALAQTVELKIEPEEGYEPDWEGSFTVTTPEGGDPTTRIRITADPRDTIQVGHYIAARFPTRVAHLEVASRGWEPGIGKGYIDVEDDGDVTEYAENGSTLTSGGKLWDPVKAAVAVAFDALGPSRSSAVDLTERYPDPDEGSPPELIVAELVAAAMGVTGVRDVVVDKPVANVPNTIAPGATPALLTMAADFLINWM
jgi:uncharacterized phage protein gp47/JayE